MKKNLFFEYTVRSTALYVNLERPLILLLFENILLFPTLTLLRDGNQPCIFEWTSKYIVIDILKRYLILLKKCFVFSILATRYLDMLGLSTPRRTTTMSNNVKEHHLFFSPKFVLKMGKNASNTNACSSVFINFNIKTEQLPYFGHRLFS